MKLCGIQCVVCLSLSTATWAKFSAICPKVLWPCMNFVFKVFSETRTRQFIACLHCEYRQVRFLTDRLSQKCSVPETFNWMSWYTVWLMTVSDWINGSVNIWIKIKNTIYKKQTVFGEICVLFQSYSSYISAIGSKVLCLCLNYT